MPTDFRSVPGYYADKTLRTRNIFTNRTQFVPQFAPTLALLDGTLTRDTGETPTDHLRAGLLVGKITTGGKYRNSIIGITTAAYVDNDTTITVPAAVATEVARLIALAGTSISLKFSGPATDATAGAMVHTAITATAASGTTITVGDLNIGKVIGSLITPADGSETITNILSPADGLDVVDTLGNSVDQTVNFLRGADLIATQIIGLTDAGASVQLYIKTALKLVGSFTFDNDR